MPVYKMCSPEEIISILEQKYFFGNIETIANKDVKMPSYMIPRPNYIEYSNQIRLIYLIDRIKLSKKGRTKMIKFIKAIKKKIERRLICFGVDKTPNLNSFIRIPYSINKKPINKRYSGEVKKGKHIYRSKNIGENRYKVYIKEYSRQRYNIQDIADKFIKREQVEEYLTELKNNKKTKKCCKSKKRLCGIKLGKYNHRRLEDIEILQLLKNKGRIDVHRENLCFAYMVHLKLCGYNDKRIILQMEQFIDRFADNSNSRELILKCKNVLKRKYTFTAKGIREYFGLDELFCKKYKLKSFLGIDYSVRKTDRKFKHLSKEKIKEILDMNADGIDVKDIAKKLNCSVQTVYIYLKNEVTAVKQKIINSIDEAMSLIKEGYSIKSIAQKLNINYETLRKRIYRYKKINNI